MYPKILGADVFQYGHFEPEFFVQAHCLDPRNHEQNVVKISNNDSAHYHLFNFIFDLFQMAFEIGIVEE